MERRITVSIGAKEYLAEAATISQGFIGFQDHGIFTAHLRFQGQSWSQSEPARSWTPQALDRYLQSVLKTLKVNDWSRVTGQEVLVLRENELGSILGFAHRSEDRYLLFETIAEE